MLAYWKYWKSNYNIWANSDIFWWMTVVDDLSEVPRKDLQILCNNVDICFLLTLPVTAFIFNAAKGLFSQLTKAMYSFT